jgi:hypothetical protein
MLRIERENISDLDPNLVDLLTSLLSELPENRYNLQQIKVNQTILFLIYFYFRLKSGLLLMENFLCLKPTKKLWNMCTILFRMI